MLSLTGNKAPMATKADYLFEVHIRIAEAFTLDSIVRSPRTFKPKDVQSACQNNDLVLKEGNPPPEVISMATYVMTDFFAMAHATGLYNRQREMWEALSKINSIAVKQLSAGLIKKTPLPAFDFYFLDYKQKPLVYAGLITGIPEKQTATGLLKQCISHAAGKPTLKGFLCCFPDPIPEDAMQYVQKQTQTSDPVARYESILPALHVPIDLLEMSKEDLSQSGEEPDQAERRTVFWLVHPDLKKVKSANHSTPPRKPQSKPTMDETLDEQSLEREDHMLGQISAESGNPVEAGENG